MTDAWIGAPARTWSAGAWSLALRDDELADVSRDGRVVLRSVRAVVRDRDWDTVPLVVDRVVASDLSLTLHVRADGLGADLRGIVRAEVRGERLIVLADLESATEFWTNRTGLVVLHPPSLAGADLRVTHSDGGVERTRFPEAISPHQPAFDIAGLAWRDGTRDVQVAFTGDVFEMEDQRNWTDASYKTYSRPLALPFPYRLDAGERVVQAIRVTVDGPVGPADAEGPARIRLEAGSPFPAIAVAATTAADPAPGAGSADPVPGAVTIDAGSTADADAGSGAGSPAGAAAVLVELDLASANWPAALARAAASGAPLDVRFVLSSTEPALIHDGVRALRGLPLARVTAFVPTGPARHVSDADAIGRLRRALAEEGVEAAVVGGVRSHFTELNREHHRLPGDLDGIVFSVTPLFHSRGTAQLVESLPMQRLVASQGVALAGGLPVHIGPVSLRPHFNDVATTEPPRSPHLDLRDGYGPVLLDAADPRQSAPELAAWTVASAAALAVPGVATLALFEEWGPRGIRAADGTAHPVAAAVAALAALSGAPALRGDSPDGLVWAVGARTPGGDVVLIANLDRVARTVEVGVDDRETRTVAVPAGGFVRL